MATQEDRKSVPFTGSEVGVEWESYSHSNLISVCVYFQLSS